MDPRIFNICLLLGWLMVTGGVCLSVGVGEGIATGGVLMIVLTLAGAYLAGWEQRPKAPRDGEAG